MNTRFDSIKMNSKAQRIKEIKEEIKALKAQWPAHSVKPWMLQQLEDLEEELAQLKAGMNKDDIYDN